jgi:N-acetylneuraminic acid mutarotase
VPLSGHAATLLASGKVLVAGGRSRAVGPAGSGCGCDNLFGYFESAWLYDPASNTWSPAAAMASQRTGFTATRLPNGKVLAAGGMGDANASAELYDPAVRAWSPAASMAVGRYGHSATLLPSGKVLVAGGGPANGDSAYTATAELYDPKTNTWSSAGSMAAGRSDHSATLLPSGKVLVVGGYRALRERKGDESEYVAEAELYDPARNAWSPAGSMKVSRAGHTATLLPSGKVLIVSGITASNHISSSDPETSARYDSKTVELYDPRTHAWSLARPMRTGPRQGHTATLLPSGQVLVAGGSYSILGFATALAELYDPQTDTWSAADMMQLGRAGHTATLLPSGQVLLTGGVLDGPAATGAELYDPASNVWSLTGPMAGASAALRPSPPGHKTSCGKSS